MGSTDPVALEREASALIARNAEGIEDLFRLDPVGTITDLLGLTVVEAAGRGGCDLDGSYHDGVITISNSASKRRRNFTACHELSHHWLQTDGAAIDWLYTQGDPDAATEQLCDAVASALLLPKHIVEEYLPTKFGARNVEQLYLASEASREAVVVGAAQQLGRPGLVVLAVGNTVQFSSSRSLTFRIGRGVEQPANSVVANVAATGYATCDREPVKLRNQTSHTKFNGDGRKTDDGYSFIVLREAPPEVDRHGREERFWSSATCPACGDTVMKAAICHDCNKVRCPKCGCECRPAYESKKAMCPIHFLPYPVTGTCERCE